MKPASNINLVINFLNCMKFKLINGKDKHYRQKTIKGHTVSVMYPYIDPKNNEEKYGSINWGNEVNVSRKTSSTFKNTESLDQLYWFCYLLKCGYKAKDIRVEQRWKSGHPGNQGTWLDFVIMKNNYAWCVLDAKTSGTQYDKYTRDLKDKVVDNQVASYYGYNTGDGTKKDPGIQYVGTITTKYNKNTNSISKDSHIVSTIGWKYVNGHVKIDASIKAPLTKAFEFSPNANPYARKYITRWSELKKISPKKRHEILNDFAELIRRNGVSDKSNAYNKILNLFIAKIYDEYRGRNSSEYKLRFNCYDPNDSSFMDNMIDLYNEGMAQLIRIKSDKSEYMNNINKILKANDIPTNQMQKIKSDMSAIYARSDSTFLFKPVYDTKTYKENVALVRQAVKILQDYRFIDPNKQEFLGDLFEGILRNGFKQESGQFFTPIPIGKYIMQSLPLGDLLKEKLKNNELPKMLDFACGSGHFLTTYMEEMQYQMYLLDPNNSVYPLLAQSRIKDLQDPNRKYEWASKCVYGIEIDYRLVKTAKIDTFLNGDGVAHIIPANALDSFNALHEKGFPLVSYNSDDEKSTRNPVFDVIVSNPPYSVKGFGKNIDTSKSSITDKFPVLGGFIRKNIEKNKEIELIFVERATQLLKDGGYIAIVLPAAFLQRSGELESKARKLFLENFNIKSITALPGKTFAATGTNTVLIMAQKRKSTEFHDAKLNAFKALNNHKDIVIDGQDVLKHYIKLLNISSINEYFKQLDIFEKVQSNVKSNILTAKSNENEINDDAFRNILYSYLKNVSKSNKSKGITIKKYLKDTNKKNLRNRINKITTFKLRDTNTVLDNIEVESNKIASFALNDHPMAVINTGNGKETTKKDKEFLGYEFSGRRGFEGIQSTYKGYSIVDLTKLYSRHVYRHCPKCQNMVSIFKHKCPYCGYLFNKVYDRDSYQKKLDYVNRYIMTKGN